VLISRKPLLVQIPVRRTGSFRIGGKHGVQEVLPQRETLCTKNWTSTSL